MWLVVTLVPLPSEVLGTCRPMSKHWAWCPSEVHTNTGRLCSAGSGCHPVPRRPRSYAALRLPAPIGHGSSSPCRWPTSLRALLLCLCGRRHVRSPTCRASETGHRLSAQPGFRRGEARASQVTGPSSSCVPWSNTPPDTLPSSPTHAGVVVAFEIIQHSRHPGRLEVSGPQSHGPHAHPAACGPSRQAPRDSLSQPAT